MKTPATIEGSDFARLKTIARQIRDGHEATQGLVKSANHTAQDALREAILTGAAMAEAKRILGVKFERWMKEHCKTVGASNATNYANLSEGQNMRIDEAYRRLGIIPGGPP